MPQLPTIDEALAQLGSPRPLPTEDEALATLRGGPGASFGPMGVPSFSPQAAKRIYNAFTGKAAETFGEEPLGSQGVMQLNPETEKWLRQTGVWNDYEQGQRDFYKDTRERTWKALSATIATTMRAGAAALEAPVAAVGQALEELGIAVPSVDPGLFGKTIGRETIEEALMDPGMAMLFPPAGLKTATARAAANARKAANLKFEIPATRAEGLLAEGEAGAFEAVPVSAENAQARVDAAKEAGIPPPIPEPVAPDVHTLARRVDPPVFEQYDALEAAKGAHRETIHTLAGAREALPEAVQLQEGIETLSQQGGRAKSPELIVARKMPDGTIVYGKPGQFHSDLLLEREHDVTDAIDAQMGFATKEGGRFMDRKQSFEWVKKNQPGREAREYPEKALEMQSYQDTSDIAKLQKRLDAILNEPTPEILRAGKAFLQAERAQQALLPDITSAYRQAREMMPLEPKVVETVEALSETPPAELGITERAVTPEVAEAATAAERVEPPKPGPGGPARSPRPGMPFIEGTGPLRTRGLSANIEASAIERGLTQSFGDLPEYHTLSMANQARLAAEYIAASPDEALKVALGEKTAPKGLSPASVMVAVEKLADAEGDIETLRRLADSRITTTATEAGRFIRIFGERSPTSTAGAIHLVQEARRAALEAKNATAIRDATKEIKAVMRKNAPSRDAWATFIQEITCK